MRWLDGMDGEFLRSSRPETIGRDAPAWTRSNRMHPTVIRVPRDRIWHARAELRGAGIEVGATLPRWTVRTDTWEHTCLPYAVWEHTDQNWVALAYVIDRDLAVLARRAERVLFQIDLAADLGVPVGDLRYRLIAEHLHDRTPITLRRELRDTVIGVAMVLMRRAAPPLEFSIVRHYTGLRDWVAGRPTYIEQAVAPTRATPWLYRKVAQEVAAIEADMTQRLADVLGVDGPQRIEAQHEAAVQALTQERLVDWADFRL